MHRLDRVTRATVDVLGALVDGGRPMWGLLLVKATGRPTGTVYPILARLENAGWLLSSWEPDNQRPGARRRLFELTPEGATAASALIARGVEAERGPGGATSRGSARLRLEGERA
ncbi:PadR family transcriptional regulator [Curtobacterium sp. MCPF17_031]|uniref:PadR family transcriptional regulator n=1 Tax=Curtobacterium sp. MCPF17_031 TaxID=2175653 RepID=UPI000DAAAC7E|nr:helix-turn-helix transcriptional regulator [Curtobacterium sp. MCPF17_031]PZE34238.1 PadR family transcriptional regulator [Curtobacterium sp. MCPF17_031]